MKKSIIALLIVLISSAVMFADDNDTNNAFKPASSSSNSRTLKYRLFDIKGQASFIQLNTITGEMYLIQSQINIKNFFRRPIVLNKKNLAQSKPRISDRFTLQPTSIPRTLILLDQIDGETYLVKWGADAMIEPLYSLTN